MAKALWCRSKPKRVRWRANAPCCIGTRRRRQGGRRLSGGRRVRRSRSPRATPAKVQEFRPESIGADVDSRCRLAADALANSRYRGELHAARLCAITIPPPTPVGDAGLDALGPRARSSSTSSMTPVPTVSAGPCGGARLGHVLDGGADEPGAGNSRLLLCESSGADKDAVTGAMQKRALEARISDRKHHVTKSRSSLRSPTPIRATPTHAALSWRGQARQGGRRCNQVPDLLRPRAPGDESSPFRAFSKPIF